jgi:hypothetical protein
MVGEPSHVKQLSLNHVCKIGLRLSQVLIRGKKKTFYNLILVSFLDELFYGIMVHMKCRKISCENKKDYHT